MSDILQSPMFHCMIGVIVIVLITLLIPWSGKCECYSQSGSGQFQVNRPKYMSSPETGPKKLEQHLQPREGYILPPQSKTPVLKSDNMNSPTSMVTQPPYLGAGTAKVTMDPFLGGNPHEMALGVATAGTANASSMLSGSNSGEGWDVFSTVVWPVRGMDGSQGQDNAFGNSKRM